MVIVTKRKRWVLANDGHRKLGCIDIIISDAAYTSLMGAIDPLTLEVFDASFAVKLLVASNTAAMRGAAAPSASSSVLD
jgi:hypothetical protein